MGEPGWCFPFDVDHRCEGGSQNNPSDSMFRRGCPKDSIDAIDSRLYQVLLVVCDGVRERTGHMRNSSTSLTASLRSDEALESLIRVFVSAVAFVVGL
jgi:hypothetical protein